MKPRKRKSPGERIIRGLTELVETLERGQEIKSRFAVRTLKLPAKAKRRKTRNARTRN